MTCLRHVCKTKNDEYYRESNFVSSAYLVEQKAVDSVRPPCLDVVESDAAITVILFLLSVHCASALIALLG